MRSNLLATAIVAGLGLSSLAFAGDAAAATKTAAKAPAVTAEQMAQLQAQMAQLQAQLDALKAQTADQQAQADAQSDVNVAQAQAIEDTQKTKESVDKLAKLVNDTKIGGRMFFDASSISQKDNGEKTDSSGTGFDVKRFYLTVDHKFNDIWSANLTTDFQYLSAISNTEVFVKKAYVQGKFDDAFTLRIGAADMPWIPYAEKFYGMRYVENTLTDRLSYGTSSDWGMHALGDLGGGIANYQVSVVNGRGYRNFSRSKSVDVEARVAFTPTSDTVIAVGGYSGKRGQETENIDPPQTAERVNLMAAYANPKGFRVGAEWFQAKNWAVTNVVDDKADGWSVWGSVPLTATGINAFARYDKANTSKDVDPSRENKYFNLGVEFPVTKGFKLAAVYKDTKNENDTTIDLHTQEFGVWGDVSF
ncbi:Phosphate-selective porin O and P [Pseudoxanthomonas sp. GM95]|uniref:porin n=1 Tax=Pseudoxanthomonas sp. GM95 TaxID=1881043 RepID=UPI0008AE7D58|nr:porin [Pseudoxanthomonas sp. GM95]SEL82023.1 Phosphate-selective porin O and P [Pseudoxanthomonas sp. GM95]